jgi:hypothetical protein
MVPRKVALWPNTKTQKKKGRIIRGNHFIVWTLKHLSFAFQYTKADRSELLRGL